MTKIELGVRLVYASDVAEEEILGRVCDALSRIGAERVRVGMADRLDLYHPIRDTRDTEAPNEYPAPWHTQDCGDSGYIIGTAQGSDINVVAANAALIAAAPDLLAELIAALRIFERDRVNATPAQYERIRTAIAKAKGKQP